MKILVAVKRAIDYNVKARPKSDENRKYKARNHAMTRGLERG
jgi:electron transfer flavoprotein alpha/beta subunit